MWWVNGGKGGKRFLERYLAVSWVMTVRLTAIYGAALTMLMFAVWKMEGRDGLDVTMGISQTWSIPELLLYSAVYFWRTTTHLKAIRSPSPI